MEKLKPKKGNEFFEFKQRTHSFMNLNNYFGRLFFYIFVKRSIFFLVFYLFVLKNKRQQSFLCFSQYFIS